MSEKLLVPNISSGSINFCRSSLTKFVNELVVTSSRVLRAKEITNQYFLLNP